MIDDTISLLEFESDLNQRLNLDGLESESSTIQFWRPNRISLVHRHYTFTDLQRFNVQMAPLCLVGLNQPVHCILLGLWVPGHLQLQLPCGSSLQPFSLRGLRMSLNEMVVAMMYFSITKSL